MGVLNILVRSLSLDYNFVSGDCCRSRIQVGAKLRATGRRQELEFNLLEDALVDIQTGSTWDMAKGIAVDGPLRGAVLQRVPYITSFDWAWEDFYPHTEFYK